MRLFALRVLVAAILVAVITGWFWVGRAIEASTTGAINIVLDLAYFFVLLVLFDLLRRLAWATITAVFKAVAGWAGPRYQTR